MNYLLLMNEKGLRPILHMVFSIVHGIQLIRGLEKNTFKFIRLQILYVFNKEVIN